MIKILRNGVEYELNVDVLEELSFYDWGRARNRGHELTACSPFRSERSPSFSINLETGLWKDFGAVDFYNKGGLVQLLSFLRNETHHEVENYLLEKYGVNLLDVDSLSLNFDLNFNTNNDTIISIEEYKQFAYRSPYLAGRGISEKVQRAFKVGYDRNNKAVALAWMDVKGNIVNIKFRSTRSKMFYYYSNGQPIRNHLYGMNFVFRMKCERVFIVESEIDALYLWSCGFPAIALGGSNLSEAQKKLLLRSPATTYVIATDNDAVGQEVKEKLGIALIGSKNLEEIVFPEYVKDINDMSPELVKSVANNTIDYQQELLKPLL